MAIASNLPPLTEADLEAYFHKPYLERGRSYYRSGNIFNPVRRGNQLEGFCEGSMPEPYLVKVTLGAGGILANVCSCPMGGHCKHVAALLLKWVHNPQEFVERQPVETALEGKSKSELIALVQEMLKREPALERLLEMPTPGERPRQTPVDPDTYRRQIRYAMRDSDDWYAVSGIAQEISSIVDIGDAFAAQGDWQNAQIVYQAVLEEAVPNYENMGHDEGEIVGEIDRAVEGLGECLAAAADDPVRRGGLLRALFDMVKWEIESGGYGISEEAPGILFEEATPEERGEIRQWIMAATERAKSDWGGEHWARLLLQLDEQEGDIEGFLQRAESLGQYSILFHKLVELGRLDEALDVAQEHLGTVSWERLQVAQALATAGREDAALAFAKAGLTGKEDSGLLIWIAERLEGRGDLGGALEMQLRRWQTRPDMTLYETLERLGQRLEQWNTLRPRLKGELERKEEYATLARIYLRERNWDAAWDAAGKVKYSWGVWGDVRLEVAQASEKERPERAIALYLEHAKGQINGRSRSTYAEAAKFLARARNLYQSLNQGNQWREVIAEIRAENRRLPALQDELNKAGL